MTAPNRFAPPSRPGRAGAIFFAAAALLAPPSRAGAERAPARLEADAYAVIEWWDDKRLPRLLTTEDVNVSAVRPESLLPVDGDFDGDGRGDIAFTGVYTLPEAGRPYFIVAASTAPMKILWREDRRVPAFVHRPGTTGPGDPGDQAFSITACVDCAKGEDARWDPEKKTFARVPWKGDRLTETTVVPVAPRPSVSEAEADAALKAAGRLKDVVAYVTALNEAGGKLGTRVEPVEGATGVARVLIFEKRAGEEKLYDAIDVRLSDGKILKRRRR